MRRVFTICSCYLHWVCNPCPTVASEILGLNTFGCGVAEYPVLSSLPPLVARHDFQSELERHWKSFTWYEQQVGNIQIQFFREHIRFQP